MMARFLRITRTLNNKGKLIDPTTIQTHIKDDSDYYTSTYDYTDDHYKQFKTTGTIAGIKDVSSRKIWFDFDSKDSTLEDARKDVLKLLERFEIHGIDKNSAEVYFSGNKGFTVILNTFQDLTPDQVKNLATKTFGYNLETLDPSLYDTSQLLRIPGTKHQESGLYKIPLSLDQLSNRTIEQIRSAAKNKPTLNPSAKAVVLKEELLKVPEKIETKVPTVNQDFDLTSKPRNWKASKWALMQGFFGPGERDTSMMILASTCKALGYDQLSTYYMCKSALKKSWNRYGEGNFNKDNLSQKIDIVFGENWKGGQYSEKDDAFLQKKADQLGIKELTTGSTTDIKGALKIFKGYAKNIDQLTLKTGIEELDSRQRITVGMSWGIVAAPGSGKTSLALQIIHSMSKAGELCVFFSYDMFAPHVIQKIIQKHWDDKEDIEFVFKKYKEGDEEYVKKVEELITKEYPNVEFCFESGQTIEDIKQTIYDAEQKRGKKCRFVVIDYNELVITDVSDPTQSSNSTAQKIRALASNEQLCILSLFQPNKQSGDPSAEIKSYLNAKGGGGIGQSVSFMLGVSRPGYDPRHFENDKYLSLNVVKNRMGPIFYIDIHWNGYKGEVRTLSAQEKYDLKKLREKKDQEKNGSLNEEW